MTEPTNKKKKSPKLHNPARFRLDFIKENTFNRIWTVRMTRMRVILVTAAIVAGGAALIWTIFAFTPLRQLLPGTLKGDLRSMYSEAALRLDSLEEAARLNNNYIANIRAVFEGEPDDAFESEEPNEIMGDSLLLASELEKEFVREYEQGERFKLSVLAPIAAEGMVFAAPISSATEIISTPGTKSITYKTNTLTPVASVYRGIVIAVTVGADGLSTVIIQHPNDFISIYSGLSDVFVEKGSKVSAAQRIAHAKSSGTASIELWHNGTALDPSEYISL